MIMDRQAQRRIIKNEREGIAKVLEAVYKEIFDQIASLDLNESDIAKLSQTLLQSKDGAMEPLRKEIENPLITKAPE